MRVELQSLYYFEMQMKAIRNGLYDRKNFLSILQTKHFKEAGKILIKNTSNSIQKKFIHYYECTLLHL